MELQDLKFDRRGRVKFCPCGKSNKDGKFAPYKGHDDAGYCHSCSKTFLPEVKKDEVSKFPGFHALRERKPETSFVSLQTMKATLTNYDRNDFAQFLKNRFGVERTNQVIGKYFIGTSRSGGTIFWQVDERGRIRSGKAIQYSAETGKRLKDHAPVWAHKALNLQDFHLEQCLYGTHLLKGNNKPCAVVESEKTATIASLYFPSVIWLACGGKSGLTAEKMQCLKGRKVTLYPDLDGFEAWKQRAEELAPMLHNIRVSDLLERKATEEERAGKLDIADYLLRYEPEDFQKPQPAPQAPEYAFDGTLIDPVKGYPVSWDIPIKTPLEKLILKNPAIAEMIQRFDLIQN